MKKLNKPKIKRRYYAIFAGIIFILFAFMAIGYYALMAADNWFNVNELVFNKPVTIVFKSPLEVKRREIGISEVIRVMETIPHPDDLETDTEKYIYEVFGIEDYKIALAIAKSESGLREDAINAYNTNGTVGVGIFQINSIHFTKEGCSLKEVATMKGNVDCAKQIYDASGWGPWVVFQTGAFKNKLD